MEKHEKKNNAFEILIAKYRKIFRIPENINHYSHKDLKIAERKFIKYALIERIVSI